MKVFSPSELPETACSLSQKTKIFYDYGDFYDTKVVLGKTKEGFYFTVYATVYLDDDNNVESYQWKYTGRDGYSVDNLECWTYIPEF